MLLTNTTEIKAFKPVMASFSFLDVAPSIKQVERDVITPLIGLNQFAQVHAAYLANALTPTLSNLRMMICEASVPLSFLKWVPWGNVKISSAGIQIASSDNMKTAFQWQVDEVKQACLHEGLCALNALLEFLEGNLSDYSLYASSPERLANKSRSIASGNELKRFVRVAYPHYVHTQLGHIMDRVERTYILAILGKEQWELIQSQLAIGTIHADVNDLLHFIRPAVANLCMCLAANELSFSINEQGVISFVGENTNTTQTTKPVADNRLSAFITQCRALADADLAELKKFLNDNLSSYPLYAAGSSYSPNYDHESFTNSEGSGFFAAL